MKRTNSIFLYFMPVVVAGVMLNILNLYALLVILILYLVTVTRKERSISFALILPPFFGSLFQAYDIPLPGALLSLVVAAIFGLGYYRTMFREYLPKLLIYIIPVFLVVLCFYIFTGETENSKTKMIGFSITLCYTPFLILLAKSEDVDMEHLTPIYLLYSLLMVRVGYDLYGYHGPLGLLDFTSFRFGGYANVRDGITHVNYQNVGVASLISVTFWLSNKQKLSSSLDFIVLFVSAWIILISGARQAILGYVIVIGVWFMLRSGRIIVINICLALIFAYLAILFLQTLDVEFIAKLFDKDSTIDRDYLYPLSIIYLHFMYGVGFGNYYDPFNELYFAHNLFLELLCEMGIVGTLLILFPIFAYCRNFLFDVKNKFYNGASALLVFTPFFIRSMISDDLSRNIIVFTAFLVFFMNDKK